MLKLWRGRRRSRSKRMAPLDFGSTHHLHVVDPLRVTAPEAYETLGGYLQAVRERRGEDLDELAETTRIRRQYLVALEDGDRSALPSRPFAIGYVRAYAAALGLDAEVAAARFKAEWPEGDQRLRNPIGVGQDHDPRRPIIYAAIAVVVAAVTLWNVAQRTLISDDRRAPGRGDCRRRLHAAGALRSRQARRAQPRARRIEPSAPLCHAGHGPRRRRRAGRGGGQAGGGEGGAPPVDRAERLRHQAGRRRRRRPAR